MPLSEILVNVITDTTLGSPHTCTSVSDWCTPTNFSEVTPDLHLCERSIRPQNINVERIFPQIVMALPLNKHRLTWVSPIIPPLMTRVYTVLWKGMHLCRIPWEDRNISAISSFQQCCKIALGNWNDDTVWITGCSIWSWLLAVYLKKQARKQDSR